MLIATFASALLASAATATVIGPLHDGQAVLQSKQPRLGRKLHGRFLHITDIHTDPYYVDGSNPEHRCHRGHGDERAGHWGTEMSSCDTPWTLVNETFRWIDENLKDQIDFVVWTGDSARHDNDVKIPRTAHQIYDINRQVVVKMREVFGRSRDDPEGPFSIPIVPTLGNNDIFPHNIMLSGPSDVTRQYENIWDDFVPQAQYHVFQKGAYFWNQVIPGSNGVTGPGSHGGLAVFSLNTLYFFDSNKAVDGCNVAGEPGYEQFEWLAIQLQIMRERGTKVILMGHVPPTWTNAKRSWDSACWKKYVKWSYQFRDIITGHLYGHMNLDHFFISDTHKLKEKHGGNNGKKKRNHKKRKHGKGSPKSLASNLLRPTENACYESEFNPEDDPLVSVSSAESYLESLREAFAEIPEPGSGKSDIEAYKNSIGGKWGERYIVTNVGPSVVPNYFPTLRVMEYNITGLVDGYGYQIVHPSQVANSEPKSNKKGKKKQPKKTKPDGPDKTAPPGPAYSVQPFTLMSYTQYFANLTSLNAGYEEHRKKHRLSESELKKREFDETAKNQPGIIYEVEYDTRTDKVYKLRDLTVRSYLKLARKIVDATRTRGPNALGAADELPEVDAEKKKGKKKKRRNGKHKKRDWIWHEFVKRAFVGTVDGEELEEWEVTDC